MINTLFTDIQLNKKIHFFYRPNKKKKEKQDQFKSHGHGVSRAASEPPTILGSLPHLPVSLFSISRNLQSPIPNSQAATTLTKPIKITTPILYYIHDFAIYTNKNSTSGNEHILNYLSVTIGSSESSLGVARTDCKCRGGILNGSIELAYFG